MWLFKILPRAVRDSIRTKAVETVNSSYVGDQIRNTHQDVEFLKNQQRIMIGQIESLHFQLQDLREIIKQWEFKNNNLKNLIESATSITNEINYKLDEHNRNFEKLSLKNNFLSHWVYRLSPQIIPLGLYELDLIKSFCIKHQISPTISSAISKNDIMFHYSLLHEKDFHRTLWGYLAVGFSGFDLIRQLIKKYFNNTSNLKILDFAAGHGRVTRFLVNEYGPEQVYSSDIKPDAVQFHKDFFGIHSFVSSYSPEEVHCDERFSFIFAGSLFSHLPRNTFYSWLRVLGSWLKPGGILAFSVHDISMLGRDPENSGFYFHASNEDLMFPEIEGHLKDEQQYGISYVSESFVRQAIAEMIPDAHLAERIIKGFGGLQDVYVIQKN
jgi:SAM-dependent methyltransferase